MKRSQEDRLLRDIWANDQVEELRAGSLAGMLESGNRRRRRRARVASAAASVAITIIAFVVYRTDPPPPSIPAATTLEPPAHPLKIINDEELFALFPGRGVALIGASGSQRLIVLDAVRNGNAPTEKP